MYEFIIQWISSSPLLSTYIASDIIDIIIDIMIKYELNHQTFHVN